MIKFKHFGNFNKTERFFKNSKKLPIRQILDSFGRRGITALSSATPKDTGVAASSWDYEIKLSSRGYSISWFNTDVTKDGVPIVILLQYGHGTGSGGYVEGQDFINPAIRPIFDQISKEVFEEVSKL